MVQIVLPSKCNLYEIYLMNEVFMKQQFFLKNGMLRQLQFHHWIKLIFDCFCHKWHLNSRLHISVFWLLIHLWIFQLRYCASLQAKGLQNCQVSKFEIGKKFRHFWFKATFYLVNPRTPKARNSNFYDLKFCHLADWQLLQLKGCIVLHLKNLCFFKIYYPRLRCSIFKVTY